MSDLDSSLLLSTSGCSSREAVLLQQPPLDQVAVIMTMAMVDIKDDYDFFYEDNFYDCDYVSSSPYPRAIPWTTT